MQLFPTFMPTVMSSVKAARSKSAAVDGSAFAGLMQGFGGKAISATPTQAALLGGSSGLKSSILRDKLLSPSADATGTADVRDTLLDQRTLRSLKSRLSALGVDDATLKQLDAEAAEGSLTWNKLLHTLGSNPQFSGKEAASAKLDESTRNGASVVLQKLGFSPEEADETVTTMEEGKLASAWNRILEKINSLGADASVTVTPEDLEHLGKAMRLDAGGITRMQQLFAGQKEAQCDSSTLKAMVAEISGSVSARQAASESRITELREVLAPVMEKALERSSQLSAADARTSRDSRASGILIKDSATADANGFTHAAAHSTASSTRKNTPADGMQDKSDAEAARHDARETNASVRRSEQASGSQDNAKGNNAHGSFAGRDQSDQSGNTSGNAAGREKDSSGLRNLLSRLEYQMVQPQAEMGATQPQSGNTTFSPNAAAAKAADQRLFEQIENGMLKTMRDGARQITMQLTPEDLGKLTIILSVKNNEVNAVIRPESAEAAKAINDQLHQLKASLENQGLKVDNIDVQTSLQNNLSGNGWQSAADHNAHQEMTRKFLNQRRLHALRAEGDGLAREMQIADETERSSSRTGLDIIA
ncbi:flagellar hook-length control protein FliK [Desulfovibrio psychrotolerans]|uniref:Flagellar hook-length control protein-like C-terminal domain-containing protein n=1 Tax=Desulfovibrio psychrotolerans TaxID=415242 RepID=A0A7J0BNS9_9BACT|nr:flagellar hook-length control protein FliK [Desulfovibrio psychrotolerans]GFM35377.1 hypothetical protein DSM19430T_00610 [Desulfovibrio psychrotolerans]